MNILDRRIVDFFNTVYKTSVESWTLKARVDASTSTVLRNLSAVENNIQDIKDKQSDLQEWMDGLRKGLRKIMEGIPDAVYKIKTNYTYFLTTVQSIREVEKTVSKLLNTVREISTVARNAEIKAFHLGDRGKGLEVVAQELDQLANRIYDTTEHITSPLQEIKTSFENAEEFSSNFLEKINFILPQKEKLDTIFSSFESTSGDVLSLSEKLSNALESSKRLTGVLREIFGNLGSLSLSSLTQGEKASILLSFALGIEEVFQENMKIFDKINSLYLKTYVQKRNLLFMRDYRFLMQVIEMKHREFEDMLKNWDEEISRAQGYLDMIQREKNTLNALLNDIDRILREVTLEHIQAMGKELASTLFSLKELTEGTPVIENVLGGDSDRFRRLNKLLVKLHALIKDGELLSLYSSVETARAGFPNDPLSIQLKELVEISQKDARESLRYISGMQKRKESDFIHKNISKFEIEGFQKNIQEMENKIQFYEEESQSINDTLQNVKQKLEEVSQWREDIMKVFEHLNFLWEKVKEEETGIADRIKKTFEIIDEISQRSIKEGVQKEKEYVLRIPLSSDPVTLNPFLATDVTSNNVIENIHKGLVQFSPASTSLLPAVAESFDISVDGLIYTFKLRDDAYFHNGEKVTSKDVIFSLKKALKGPSRQYFEVIKGAKSFIQGKTNELEGLKILKENEFQIHLKYPYTPFLFNLALTSASIVREENGKLIGCGPFVLISWEKGNAIILKPFEKYFIGKPLLDRVKFLIGREENRLEDFISGKFDMLSVGREDSEKIDKEYPELKESIRSIPEISIHRFDFNNTKPPFSDKRVRKAIAHAIDTKKFVQDIVRGEGIPAKGIFPPSSWVYNPELKGYTYDLNIAKKLLKESGYEQGFEFTLTLSDSPTYKRYAKFLHDSLLPLNIRIKTEEKPWSEFLEILHTGKTQAHIIGWLADTGDPDSMVYPLFHSSSIGGGGNECMYSSEKVNKMIEEARRLREPESRKKLYQEIEEEILLDCPCVFLFHPIEKVLVKEGVYGISPHPIGHHRLWMVVKE